MPRRLILAPDSFKECLTAAHVAAAMKSGVLRADAAIEAIESPIGDGGEGTLDALIQSAGGSRIEHVVTGPMGDRVFATFGVLANGLTAVIELAQAAGLALIEQESRDPMCATTRGVGELTLQAIDRGCDAIIVCIGGSATVDGGTGIAQACGFRFIDANDSEIREPMCGGALHRIARIERPLREWPRIRVACDVTNPLCGENGAAAIFGPQKGASPEQVRLLDAGLAHLASIAGGDPNAPGAGAAGGAGYGLVTFFGAKLERGIDLVLEAVGFHELCRDAKLVLTGEGRLDGQSLSGKACIGVAKAAAEFGVPTIAIVGTTGEGAEQCLKSHGGFLDDFVSLTDRFGRDRSKNEAEALISEVAQELVAARAGT